MSARLSEEEIYAEAKKRVKEKNDFYVHLTIYLIVNSILIITWALSGGGYPWFLWCLGPWGIGIVAHFLGVFVFPKGDKIAVEKEAERIKKEQE